MGVLDSRVSRRDRRDVRFSRNAKNTITIEMLGRGATTATPAAKNTQFLVLGAGNGGSLERCERFSS